MKLPQLLAPRSNKMNERKDHTFLLFMTLFPILDHSIESANWPDLVNHDI